MPTIIFLFFYLFLAEDPKRSLTIEEKGIKLEIIEADLKESQSNYHFRKLLVKKTDKLWIKFYLRKATEEIMVIKSLIIIAKRASVLLL